MILPPELEREITSIEFALPGKEELRLVLAGIMESAAIKNMEAETQEKVIDAACGLTTIEAENAFALSVAESKGIPNHHAASGEKFFFAFSRSLPFKNQSTIPQVLQTRR